MNQELTFNPKRTPETHYFKNGLVKFFRYVKSQLGYTIYKWNEEGTLLSMVEGGKVKDDTHLKQLLAIQDLGSVSQ